MNILYNNKNKLFKFGGAFDDFDVNKYTSINIPNSLYDKNELAKYGMNNDFSINNNAKYGMTSDFKFNKFVKFGMLDDNPTDPLSKDNSKKNDFDFNKFMNKASDWGNVAQVGVQGAMVGLNNTNQGMHDTTMGVFQKQKSDANNVSKSYSAGQQINLLNDSTGINSANNLKTHKGWKNILGSTASGALAGASVGGAWGAVAGAAIGLVGSTVGEILGKRKRQKQEEQEKLEKQKTDYAIDYYNDKQFEQLASANNQAAKVTADQNRTSTLALMAYGGKRNNFLINSGRILLC